MKAAASSLVNCKDSDRERPFAIGPCLLTPKKKEAPEMPEPLIYFNYLWFG
jgi:hypothetical protein